MPLEAVIIVLDNSLYARNGDILPNRWDSQCDAMSMIASAKLNENLESHVGLMLMGGRNPEILVTPIADLSKINASINKIQVKGDANFSKSIDIASLALKHRTNKNSRQRIVIMVASPLNENEQDLKNLGKKLRRNNVSVDVINLGEYGNKEKLQSFIECADQEESCTFQNLEPGLQLLSDAVTSSRILNAGGDANFGMGNQDFGGDINDVDLEMALRASAEEYRQMEEAQKKTGEDQPEDEKKDDGMATEDQKEVNDEAQAQNQNENKANEDLEKEEEKLLDQVNKNLSVGPKKDLEEVTKIVNDPDFLGEILQSLGMDDEALINELTSGQAGGEAKVPAGTYKATSKKDNIEVSCVLVLKDDMTYEYKEDNEATQMSLLVQTGTYKLDKENVVCEPVLSDNVKEVLFDKAGKTVKLVTKND